MSKKQALTEFHRGSILAAAERLFAEKGTEKTTMDDIAREAEYSKATLYVYFQSKEEIINAILLSGMVLLKKKLHEAIESHTDWFQAYDAVCQAIVRFYDENPTALESPIDPSIGLIEGWNQGVVGMKLGGVRELTISGDLAYGDTQEICGGYGSPLKFIIMAIEKDETLAQLNSELDDIYLQLYYAYYGSQI